MSIKERHDLNHFFWRPSRVPNLHSQSVHIVSYNHDVSRLRWINHEKPHKGCLLLCSKHCAKSRRAEHIILGCFLQISFLPFGLPKSPRNRILSFLTVNGSLQLYVKSPIIRTPIISQWPIIGFLSFNHRLLSFLS